MVRLAHPARTEGCEETGCSFAPAPHRREPTVGAVVQHLGMGEQRTVWVFHGEKAQFAAGVFESEADGLNWAARHGVSGLLTEYPVGDGCYDIAVAEGHFVPKRPHHGTPEHVAQFSPGWTRHVHIEDGRR